MFHNDDLTFRAAPLRHRASAALKRIAGTAATSSMISSCLVDDLAEAESTGQFDTIWDLIYDEADYDRVSIATF